MLRLHAPEFVLGVRHLVGRIPRRGVILLQLNLEFGDLENGHDLAFLYPGSIVDQEIMHIAGLLGINVDLLERHQFGGHRELALESLPADLDDANGYRVRSFTFGAHFLALDTARQAAGHNYRQTAGRPKKLDAGAIPAIRVLMQPNHRFTFPSGRHASNKVIHYSFSAAWRPAPAAKIPARGINR